MDSKKMIHTIDTIQIMLLRMTSLICMDRDDVALYPEDMEILLNVKGKVFRSIMFLSPFLSTITNHCIINGFSNKKFMESIRPVVERHESLKLLYRDYTNKYRDIGDRVRYVMNMKV